MRMLRVCVCRAAVQKKRTAHHWARQRFLHLMRPASKLITGLKILFVVQIPIWAFFNYAPSEENVPLVYVFHLGDGKRIVWMGLNRSCIERTEKAHFHHNLLINLKSIAVES